MASLDISNSWPKTENSVPAVTYTSVSIITVAVPQLCLWYEEGPLGSVGQLHIDGRISRPDPIHPCPRSLVAGKHPYPQEPSPQCPCPLLCPPPVSSIPWTDSDAVITTTSAVPNASHLLRASKMQFEMHDNVKGKAMSYPVTSQPQCASGCYQTQLSDWHTGLTDCCNDMPICLCGTFAPLCLACRISDDFGECCCAPYLPGGLHSLRTGMRERYHIQGSVGHDWAALTFCLPCALCQMARELKIRE